MAFSSLLSQKTLKELRNNFLLGRALADIKNG